MTSAEHAADIIISEHHREFVLKLREALLLALRAAEDYLGMPRSVPTKRG